MVGRFVSLNYLLKLKMSITLKNKKILISAGGSGIGWSSAKIFLDKGATVYLCDIN